MADAPTGGGENINQNVNLSFNVQGPDPTVLKRLNEMNKTLQQMDRLMRPLDRQFRANARVQADLGRSIGMLGRGWRDTGRQLASYNELMRRNDSVTRQGASAMGRFTGTLGVVAAGAAAAVHTLGQASDSILRLQLVSRDSATAAKEMFAAYKQSGAAYASVKSIAEVLGQFKSKGLAESMLGDNKQFVAGMAKIQSALAKTLGSQQEGAKATAKLLEGDLAMVEKYVLRMAQAGTQEEMAAIAKEWTATMDDAGKAAGMTLANAMGEKIGDETYWRQLSNKISAWLGSNVENFMAENPGLSALLSGGGTIVGGLTALSVGGAIASGGGVAAGLTAMATTLATVATAVPVIAAIAVDVAGIYLVVKEAMGLWGDMKNLEEAKQREAAAEGKLETQRQTFEKSADPATRLRAQKIAIDQQISAMYKDSHWYETSKGHAEKVQGSQAYKDLMEQRKKLLAQIGEAESGSGGRLARLKGQLQTATGDDRKKIEEEIAKIEADRETKVKQLNAALAQQGSTTKDILTYQSELELQYKKTLPIIQEIARLQGRQVSTQALAGVEGAGFMMGDKTVQQVSDENSKVLDSYVNDLKVKLQYQEKMYADYQAEVSKILAQGGKVDSALQSNLDKALEQRIATANALAEAEKSRTKSYTAVQEEQLRVLSMNTTQLQSQLEVTNALYGSAALGLQQQMEVVNALEAEKGKLQEMYNIITRQIAQGDHSQETLKRQLELREQINQKVRQELEMTKNLRDGYLGAIQAQVTAGGAFEAIIVTQEKNMGKAMENGLFKANYLLGQIGEAARASNMESMRFTNQFGVVQTAGGESVTNRDVIMSQINNVADPQVRAILMQMASGASPDLSAYAGQKATQTAANSLGQGVGGQQAVGYATSQANPNAQPGFVGSPAQQAAAGVRSQAGAASGATGGSPTNGSAVQKVRAAMELLLQVGQQVDDLLTVQKSPATVGPVPSSQP